MFLAKGCQVGRAAGPEEEHRPGDGDALAKREVEGCRAEEADCEGGDV